MACWFASWRKRFHMDQFRVDAWLRKTFGQPKIAFFLLSVLSIVRAGGQVQVLARRDGLPVKRI